jgi:hypothetical protein
VGPYAVLGRRFVVESATSGVLDVIVNGFGDLPSNADGSDVTVYRVDRTGPRWHPYGWSTWRDEELISAEGLGAAVPISIPSDFARHVAGGRDRWATITGVALARHGGAVVLTVDASDGPDIVESEPVDLYALAVQAMRRGWQLVALDAVVVDMTRDVAVALPFHRPFAANRDSPLSALIGAAGLHRLVPASSLGDLAGPTDVIGCVLVRRSTDAVAGLEPASPASVLRALATQVGGGYERSRSSFVLLAELAERLPGRMLRFIDDLDASAAHLELLA